MNITGGKYNGRKVLAPDENITRPTLSKVRMGVFNTLFSILGEFGGKSFLDLFGGSGIMGLEALSRGFEKVTVCEKNPKAVQIIKKNYETLGLKPDLYPSDALKFLKNTDKTFDVIYIDPPYQSGIYEDVFKLLKEKNHTDTIIIAEHSEPINTSEYLPLPLKHKNYGGKTVSFYRA